MKGIKTAAKIAGIVLGILAAVVIAILLFYTVREYRPQAVEEIAPAGMDQTIERGSDLSLLTYNIGFAGLDASQDFFMDGGNNVRPEDKAEIEDNLKGISEILKKENCDVYFLQEVDRNAKRSYYINENAYFEEVLGLKSMFACNFKCDFVPYPFPPIGKVDSGIATFTSLPVSKASRISLPESFSWPVKTCNLKRCILETRIPIGDTDAELVLLNFHLEAYDDGSGKEAQTKMLAEKLQKEYELGNYVIAGGDFNQTFEETGDSYPLVDQENWVPGIIREDSLPEHFSFALDDSYPTCRLLNQPYTNDYETSQVYVLDGFIVSDNVKIEKIQVINTNFAYADHQPVRLEVTIQ